MRAASAHGFDDLQDYVLVRWKPATHVAQAEARLRTLGAEHETSTTLNRRAFRLPSSTSGACARCPSRSAPSSRSWPARRSRTRS